MKPIRRKCSSRPIHIIDESLRPISVGFLVKRLNHYIKNFNDYVVYADENNLEVDANILEIVTVEQLDNFISKFEWLVNSFNDDTLFLTPKRIQIKNNTVNFDDKILSYKFYHISDISPDIILKTGLRIKDSLKYLNYRFERHEKNIYLVSDYLVKKMGYSIDSALKNLAKLFYEEYHSSKKFYVYEVNLDFLHNAEEIYSDISMDSSIGVFITQNINPKFIKYSKTYTVNNE